MSNTSNNIMSTIKLISEKAMIFIVYTFSAILAIATLACFLPQVPVFGVIGPLIVFPFGPWVSILSLLAALLFFFRWRKFGKRGILVLTSFTSFVFAGTAFIQIQQIAVAEQNGVDINLLRTLWLGGERHGSVTAVIETYTRYEDHDLAVAIYSQANSKEKSPKPVLVYVHGGGWGAGTVHDRAADMRWFADQGYLVFSVEYSLSAEDRHTWGVAERQVACALAWIGRNAERYGGDGSRLAMFGESAGGNLVLNVSYQANAGLIKPMCEGQVPNIVASIAAYPIIDARQMYENDDVIVGRFARMMGVQYTGGTPEAFPGRYKAISSETHINSSAPATLLLPGLTDHLLHPEPVYAFAKKAIAAGVDARVIGFPYGEHSFDQLNGGIGSQLMRGASLQLLIEFGLAPLR